MSGSDDQFEFLPDTGVDDELVDKEGPSAFALLGPMMSFVGFTGILLQVLDVLFDWVKIDRVVQPRVLLVTSCLSLIFGSAISRFFGNRKSKQNSRALFTGALGILLLPAFFLLISVGVVVLFFWMIAEN